MTSKVKKQNIWQSFPALFVCAFWGVGIASLYPITLSYPYTIGTFKELLFFSWLAFFVFSWAIAGVLVTTTLRHLTLRLMASKLIKFRHIVIMEFFIFVAASAIVIFFYSLFFCMMFSGC